MLESQNHQLEFFQPKYQFFKWLNVYVPDHFHWSQSLGVRMASDKPKSPLICENEVRENDALIAILQIANAGGGKVRK